MADLFSTRSPQQICREVESYTREDMRSLPMRAKVFAAIVKMQGFDGHPALLNIAEIDVLLPQGYIELNRGISGTKSLPARMYASELVRGPMYPGTLSAFGTGIYLSTTSDLIATDPRTPAFPKISKTAQQYAAQDDTGMVIRCLLKPDAKILTQDQIREIRRDNRNRARESQLTDFGALTAALGFDGFICEKIDNDNQEVWYVVVNRTALIFQTRALQRGHT